MLCVLYRENSKLTLLNYNNNLNSNQFIYNLLLSQVKELGLLKSRNWVGRKHRVSKSVF